MHSIELDLIIEKCAHEGMVDKSMKAAYKEIFSTKKATMIEFMSAINQHIADKCRDIPYTSHIKSLNHAPEAIKEPTTSSDKLSLEFVRNFIDILDAAIDSHSHH